MTAKNHPADVNPENHSTFRNLLSALVAAVICLAALIPPLAKAQTFQVLHSFTGKGGGTESYAGVTLDRAGNVYGTTIYAVFTTPRSARAQVAGSHLNSTLRGRKALFTPFKDGRQAGVRPDSCHFMGWQ